MTSDERTSCPYCSGEIEHPLGEYDYLSEKYFWIDKDYIDNKYHAYMITGEGLIEGFPIKHCFNCGKKLD